MEYSFHSAKANKSALLSFGFSKSGDAFLLRQELSGTDFFAEISIKNDIATVEVFERESGEKYELFNVKSASGAFLADIREKVQAFIDEIKATCFEKDDIKERYIAFLKDELASSADFPWAADEKDDERIKSSRYSDAAVFRCPNKKWFALIMNISYKNLGVESDEAVSVVNLKAESDKILALIDRKSIFPAFHMNKKHWITVVLTLATDFSSLCDLTRKSFSLVNNRK